MDSNRSPNRQDIQDTTSPIINDFCITFSTINGSGSATANTTILRALFKMGIPVSGKNIFPSNIQGLPTWYTIRINKNGYTARLAQDDIVVAMNPSTIDEEMKYIVPGGVLFYADDITLPALPADVTTYPMPVKKMMKEAEIPSSIRDYVANMVYVGILAHILGIDFEKIRLALDFHFKGKEKPIESNFAIITRAAEWAKANLVKKDRYQIQPMHETEGCIMSDGNTAAAVGSIFGGVQFTAWYPITPASSLAESLYEYLPMFRTDPETGKATYAVVQAEDELAAIGMAIGAGFAGLRSMTSTSGPGLSLMTEYLGLAYYSEVPVVIWDVQRVGPSTGLPTRTAQGDLTFSYFMGHGDTQFLIMIPGSIDECFEFGWKAFDLAERFQMPVILLIDLDLGMNQWMSKKFEYPDKPIDRGKILWEEDLKKMISRHDGKWGRYWDVDGDFIPYRTVIGNQHPESGYFARGTGHDEFTHYTEAPEVWERVMERLARKYDSARLVLPAPELQNSQNSRSGIISSGAADPAVQEARDQLLAADLPVDYLRVRAIPFSKEVHDFIQNHDQNYVVELNRDGQLHQLLSLDNPEYATKLVKVAHCDGLPLTARWIKEQVLQLEEK